MGCKDVCDPDKGPVDSDGSVITRIVVEPIPTGSTINISATAEEDCTNIQEVEYYFDECDSPGQGNSMDAVDGSFDEQIEDVEALNILPSKNGIPLNDGRHTVCVRAKNSDGCWGDCNCTSFEIDRVAPNNPDDMALNNRPWVTELIVCGEDPLLTGHVCDTQSKLQAAEYFIDNFNLPNWYGYPMKASDGNFDEECEDVEAIINITPLSEGTHYVKFHAKDRAENWGKLEGFDPVSFIKDTVAPTTVKTVSIPKIRCDLANECWYINSSTKIKLECSDYNPGDNEYSGNPDLGGWVKIKYRIRWKEKWNNPWGGWSEWNENGNSLEITLNEESYHEIEYFCYDYCGNEETHHFEIDIVDNSPPDLIKIIGNPNIPCSPNENCDYWVRDHVTNITLDCVDPEPHPVDHETLCYRVSLDSNDVTQNYCSKFGGSVKNGYCCIDVSGEKVYNLSFTEDSLHELEFYCEDALGNKNESDVETFRVDSTPPETTKTYGNPHYPENINSGALYPHWITSQTPITLTAEDEQDPCAVGVKETKYRVTQIDNDYCESQEACQTADGTGDWNVYTEPFTINQESCHLIEYYSVDKLGNEESVKKQCVYVENTPPRIDKSVGEPKHKCTESEWESYGEPDFGCWYITQNTVITLNCYDVEPHPVNQVKLYYRDYLLGETPPAYTEVDGGYAEIQKTEDSEHVLEFYCVDALGNSNGDANNPHVEIDIVDTQPPVSEKELGDPKHACEQWEQELYYPNMPEPTDGCYFITQNTPITITCEDGEPHPVDHVKLYYRDYLVGEDVPEFTEVDGNEITFTKEEDSAHILEWYCMDELGNKEETHVEYDIVDTVPPEGTKIVGEPKIPCEDGEGCNYWVRDHVTEITLDCTDPQPHPVDHEKLCYKISFDDPPGSYLTEQYCTEFGGTMEGDECCVDVSGDAKYTFTFQEDS
ncbi:MAG: hypothetical protein DRP18_04860, partial [Candidatus Aenigmatarchaeota archaeon]